MTTMKGSLQPFVSVVIETITAREREDVEPFPRSAAPDDRWRHCPGVPTRSHGDHRYFAAKNAGADIARGDIVALLDGDCIPELGWLAALISRFEPGVGVVAGRTRYTGRSLTSRTFSVPDFGNVVAATDGDASGFNVNNVAFRRDLLLAHPLDSRIRRNGGCYFLYHELRAEGVRIVYQPDAVISHGLDVDGLGFVRKHFDRGFDGTNVYRLDVRQVLRGTPIYRRFGAFGLTALTARRIALDWLRLVRHGDQMSVPRLALPYFAAVTMMVRLIELAGGIAAGFRRPPNVDAGRSRV